MKPTAYARIYRYRLGYDIEDGKHYVCKSNKQPKPKAIAGTGGFKLKNKKK